MSATAVALRDNVTTMTPAMLASDGLACVRCWKCRHKMLRIELDALAPRKRLEVKCNSCKTLNHLIGASAVTPAASTQST